MNPAAYWVTRMQSGQPAEADQERFEQWLGEDPRHAEEYVKALQIWRQLTVMRHSTEYGRLLGEASLRERMLELWHVPKLQFAAVSAALTVVVFLGAWLWMRDGADLYRTEIAQVRSEILEDGTRVTLAPQSVMRTQYTAGERRLILMQGQIYVDVARDAHRPYRVVAGEVGITALGTAFEVRKTEEVRVTVLEGKVSVATEGVKAPVVLNAGEQTVARAKGGVEAPRRIESKDPASWRMGRLVYDNVALSEVVSDANRYSHRRIVLKDPALGEFKVTTSFLAGQTEVLVDTLEGALPVVVERRTEEIVLSLRGEK